MSDLERSKEAPIGWAAVPQLFGPAVEYATDLVQRQILFWDTLRQRGNQYREQSAKLAPHVLNYSLELVADGRTFERPVNYLLVRIVPPKGVEISPTARPFVIVDPRAGHGPGIGGFKADSEIGVAMKAGHPATSSASSPTPCRDKPSKTSAAQRRSSSKRSLRCTPKPMANRAWLEIARRAGPS